MIGDSSYIPVYRTIRWAAITHVRTSHISVLWNSFSVNSLLHQMVLFYGPSDMITYSIPTTSITRWLIAFGCVRRFPIFVSVKSGFFAEMDRRDFLKKSAIGVTAMAVTSIVKVPAMTSANSIKTKHESYMKKIIIIDGGPRRNMNTAGMLQAFAEGARSAGKEVDVKMERLAFPWLSYNDYSMNAPKRMPVVLIETMNGTPERNNDNGYGSMEYCLTAALNKPERIIAYNTYQVKNYDRFELASFSEEAKRKWRDEHWEKDLRKAFEAGKRMAADGLSII